MTTNHPPCFTTTLELHLAEKLKSGLIDQGFELGKPMYTIFQAKKKGISLTLYQSGKLTVQGKDKDEFITYYLEPEILGNVSYSYPHQNVTMHARIGIDEAGKGDYFGPLCIAGLYVNGEEDIKKLLALGVKDSKCLTDTTILKIAKEIRQNFKFSVIKISPKRYNEMYATFHNLNHLLAWGHATAIEKLVQETSCKNVLIDQFANESVVERALAKKSLDVNLTQRHRGEEDPVVAGASILARAAFVEAIAALEVEHKLTLPKGASAAVKQAAKKAIATYGAGILSDIAKMHFKTTEELLKNA